MDAISWMIIGILLIVIAVLLMKIRLLQKSVREIEQSLSEKLDGHTNTLIDVTSRDPNIRNLASSLNNQLCLLRKERHRYEQANQELEDSAIDLVHDLRTPLTSLFGYISLLRQEKDPEKRSLYIEQIEERSRVMKKLLDELFDNSLLLASREPALQPVDMAGMLEESLLSFFASFAQLGIEPQIQMPEHPVIRNLDPAILQRIFSNIIANAIKYSDGSFQVVLSEEGTITFSNPARNLDPLTAGKLFERYYTVDAAAKSSGLGLSIAKALTEKMNGTIEAWYRENVLTIQLKFSK